VPSFDAKEVIHGFCGARAKSSRGDWIIEPSPKNGRFIQAAGIDSPGLAGSPAVAREVVRLLAGAGLELAENPSFNPVRLPIVRPKNGWRGIKAGPPGKYTDPAENVVCKCEKVTEAEVAEALRRSLPIDSTQAVRKRTRAGMGSCQAKGAADGGYDCECRVAGIIARENGYQWAGEVGRRPWPATSTLPERWIPDSFRARLEQFMGA
jgi:glycerol-3-phosphate dehydrogenase